MSASAVSPRARQEPLLNFQSSYIRSWRFSGFARCPIEAFLLPLPHKTTAASARGIGYLKLRPFCSGFSNLCLRLCQWCVKNPLVQGDVLNGVSIRFHEVADR